MALIHKKRGFTLVELLIVITIIGILAAALIPQITGAQAKARDTGRSTSVNGLRTAFASFSSDNGVFPTQTTLNATNGCLSTWTGFILATGSGFSRNLPTGVVPVDPTVGRTAAGCTVGQSYGYKEIVSTDGSSSGAYILIANVESNSKGNYSGATLATSATSATIVQAGMISNGVPAAASDASAVYVVLGS